MKSGVDILGISVTPYTTPETVVHIRESLQAGKRLHVVTFNNEMAVRTRHDRHFRQAVEDADLRIADTAGIIWAGHFLHRQKGGYGAAVRSLLLLLLIPRLVRTEFPETVPGSDLAVDLAGMCEEFGFRLFLLGAGEGVAEQAGQALLEKFPQLQIAGAMPGWDGRAAHDEELREAITAADAQVLLVAYGPPKQEEWIARNLSHLPAPLAAMGIGGTFDYLAGAAPVGGGRTAKPPPAFVRRRGLEWLWRLVTQPSRFRRIYTAFPVFVRTVVRHKSQSTKR